MVDHRLNSPFCPLRILCTATAMELNMRSFDRFKNQYHLWLLISDCAILNSAPLTPVIRISQLRRSLRRIVLSYTWLQVVSCWQPFPPQPICACGSSQCSACYRNPRFLLDGCGAATERPAGFAGRIRAISDGSERAYSAAMPIAAGCPIAARHSARLSPSGSTSAAVRALATASAARASGIWPASAGRITRASIWR